MLQSSLGFHTMTLSIMLLKHETRQLIMDFRKYSQKTGNIKIYPDKYRNTVIEFAQNNRGIKWLVRYNVWMNGFEVFFDVVNVTINPKILGGIHDYITAATYSDMKTAISNFNLISKEISPLLNTFDCYSLKRIDYCVNFCLNELVPGCSHEQIMKLIKRSDIPPHYKEWTEYDDVSHRKKSRAGSFYLINQSVNINCYSKYMKFQEQSQKNMEKGYAPIKQETLDASRSIIRFEVQCKYHKMYTLSKKAVKSGNNSNNKYKSLLTYEACNETVNYYFNKIIGKSDWYALSDAVRIIKCNHFNKQKEKHLIDALNFVSQCRSLAKAKKAYQGSSLEAFKRTLKELSTLNINPVTIPKEWGIRHIPNLLYTYYDKVQMEKIEMQIKMWQMEEFLNKSYL